MLIVDSDTASCFCSWFWRKAFRLAKLHNLVCRMHKFRDAFCFILEHMFQPYRLFLGHFKFYTKLTFGRTNFACTITLSPFRAVIVEIFHKLNYARMTFLKHLSFKRVFSV